MLMFILIHTKACFKITHVVQFWYNKRVTLHRKNFLKACVFPGRREGRGVVLLSEF